MKIICLLCIIFTISFTSCINDNFASDEMMDILRKEWNISEEIVEYGTINSDDKVIKIARVGHHKYNYEYYAGVFLEKQEESYQFEQRITLYKVGWQEMRIGIWNGGYVLVCDNPNAEVLKIIIHEREKKEIVKIIEIEKIPFVYYLDLSKINVEDEYNIEFRFLDEYGNEVR